MKECLTGSPDGYLAATRDQITELLLKTMVQVDHIHGLFTRIFTSFQGQVSKLMFMIC